MTEIGHLLFNTQSFFHKSFSSSSRSKTIKKQLYYLVVATFFGQKFLFIIVMHFDKLLDATIVVRTFGFLIFIQFINLYWIEPVRRSEGDFHLGI